MMKNLYLLFSRTSKFLKLSWSEKILFIEAFLLTGIIRFAIVFVPFKKVAKVFGKINEESIEHVSDSDKLIINKIIWAVNVIGRHTPWESKCLVKALTGQIMLKNRKLDSTLYLGVAKDEENKLIAHAWLRCGADIITGDDVREKFTMVAKFASIARRMKV